MTISFPNKVDVKWLVERLESVAVQRVPQGSEAAKLAREANDPETNDSWLRGGELTKVFEGLQKANGETGKHVTLKDPDGSLTKAGQLLDKLAEARGGRDLWFDAPAKGQVLYADFKNVDLGFFHGNDAAGKPIHVTGVPTSALSIYWAPSGPAHYEPPTDLGVLYYERGQTVDLRRSGNTSVNDAAASFRTELSADGVKSSGAPEDFKAKNLNRDPSTVRRALSADFFAQTLKLPVQRMAPVKWFANGWYQGLRDLEEPLDRTMWKRAVQTLDPKRAVTDDVWIFKAQWTEGFEAVGGGKLEKADLKYRKGATGDDRGQQYRAGAGEQTYDLKTNRRDADQAYDAFAGFVRTVNGVGLKDARGRDLSATDPGRFNTDAYRKAMESNADVYGMLRAYTGLVLTGSWDNLINPSNFAWVGEKAKDGKVKFSALPVDLESSWGVRWDGQPAWQDLDLLLRTGDTANVPVIWKNLLANDHFKAYVLDYVEHLLKTDFTPAKIGGKANELWQRNKEAVYLESDTAHGGAHTARPYTNDEIYRHNELGHEMHKNGLYAPAIKNYVEWRSASARHQLREIRASFTQRAGVDFARGELEPR
jgi:hypothetical protein